MASSEILIVDGYNIIFAWDELKKLAETSLELARGRLADILCNYQGYKKNEIILVFDAYKVKENSGKIIHYHNIDIIYTKEQQTADAFIEAISYQTAGKYQVRVATSDGMEQIVILTNGAARMTARELYKDVEETKKEIEKQAERLKDKNKRRTLLDMLSGDDADIMNNLRLTEDENPSEPVIKGSKRETATKKESAVKSSVSNKESAVKSSVSNKESAVKSSVSKKSAVKSSASKKESAVKSSASKKESVAKSSASKKESAVKSGARKKGNAPAKKKRAKK